jgi:FkbM family methyltransferase
VDETRFLELCGRAIGKLRPDRAARIKENIHVTGHLDYPRKRIAMTVDNVLQIARLRACKKEPETVAWIETYMRPGDVFFDIGANVGAYSFVADSVAQGKGVIFAFEPSYATFNALVANVQLNQCGDRIRTLQIALSSETKLETFNYSSTTAGAAMHGLGHAIDEEGRPFTPAYSQTVIAYRMDDLIAQFGIPFPNHIKIDVDGSEKAVIDGAAATLANHALRSLLIEIDERKAAHGEIVRVIQERGLRFVSKNPRNGPGLFNFVFEREK